MKVMGVKQNLSTAYHPQTDGQTERVNQGLEAYLRVYVDYAQDDWSEWLPMAEFAYNNADHSSTGMSPFYANYGFHPRLEVSAIEGSDEPLTEDFARVYIEDLRKTQAEAAQAISVALKSHKQHYDRKRKEAPPYKEGDLVFLSAENIKTTRPSKKLADKQLGPFKITEGVSPHAVRLDLPASMGRTHSVFGVNLLEPAKEDTISPRAQDPPQPVITKDTQKWEVEEICDSRKRKRRLEYQVRWKGYQGKLDEYTWESASNLKNAPELMAAFHRAYPKKPKP
jgi:hypothetical protein